MNLSYLLLLYFNVNTASIDLIIQILNHQVSLKFKEFRFEHSFDAKNIIFDFCINIIKMMHTNIQDKAIFIILKPDFVHVLTAKKDLLFGININKVKQSNETL